MANTLNAFRNGAVGFIDWLGAADDMLQSGDESDQHEYDHAREDDKSDPRWCRWHQRELERDRLRREEAVNAEDAECDAEQREEHEKDPRTRKIVAALDAHQTSLLSPIRGIANK